ncbi:MAG: spermidine/putrescine ABC transporter substrate-binding protein, partial [Desulfobulbaceae bacterium]
MKRLMLLIVLLVIGPSAAMAGDALQLLTWKGYAPKELVEKFEKET